MTKSQYLKYLDRAIEQRKKSIKKLKARKKKLLMEGKGKK